ncbi:MAG TPA: TraB/GumN family protein [Noviherbaspirillum sp.]|uniref:TraB/GumN family protein n=1 Tax=Noviherbaspirillum sp. TaxID=1926288 RepID=UPI002D502B1A|nr:TraB/GumN family protein [Noviherbaspirillum sp.]HYD94588.1 TraB/GumN family protein [Noviherbaspirillum sp.]
MLYRVRHGDNTAWLFGTIHVGTPDFFPLDAQVTQALSGASKLVLEIDIRRPEPFQAALHKHGYYPPGDSVDRHLPADDLARLDAALRQFGITPHQVRHMKPWLLANLLVGLDLERNGYRRSHGTEMFLLSLAAQDAKAVDELESAEYQMALFDGMPDAMQVRYLRENLAELGDGNALKKSVALIDAWATANGEAAEAFVRDTRGENSASSEFTLRVLLDKRNPEMATKIEALLRGGEAAFVGVGLLHMVGENGLPALLKQRGYEVEKVY